MRIQKLAQIDDRGFYQHDVIVPIAETLEEAKSLSYPITKRIEYQNADLAEPEQIGQLKAQIDTLRALPKSDIIDAAISGLESELIQQVKDYEDTKTRQIEIEEFQIPPFPPNQIEIEIPQTSGFHYPRWDGFRWIEGLTPEEIAAKNPKPINWDGFVQDWLMSDLDDAIATTTNQNWLIRLQIALDKRPDIDLDWLVTVFNQCVAGMPQPFSTAQIKTAKSMVKDNHIPLTVNKDGAIAIE